MASKDLQTTDKKQSNTAKHGPNEKYILGSCAGKVKIGGKKPAVPAGRYVQKSRFAAEGYLI
ncbi:hypothetical protein [Thermosyntropha lipolytica]|uniref:hypothetical protein n=1 Tax=Thermosyntropha lipolytica TaxID=54294 RepID=UPI001160C7AB|nr:hypothetical protein [Thermosyntropha lipolytica]